MSEAPKFDLRTIAWVTGDRSWRDFLASVETASLVVLDLETTGLDEWAERGGLSNGGVSARIVLASATVEHEGETEPTTWVIPLSHPQSPLLGTWREKVKELAEHLIEYQVPLGNQNIKFDLRWVHAISGVDLSELVFWDTQISGHLLDENVSHKLKVMAPEAFGIEAWNEYDLSYPGAAEDAPLAGLGEYAAQDTYWAWRLIRLHRAMMFLDENSHDEPEDEQEFVHARLGRIGTWVSMPTVASLTRIEQNGIGLDLEWVNTTLTQARSDIERLSAEMHSIYPDIDGKVSTAANSKWFLEWTRRAMADGRLRVGGLTPTGAPQWGKSVLIRQARNGSETAQLVLDHRKATKLSQFLRSWQEKVTPHQRIHANYNVGSVVTGRLSSSNPNMQQVTKSLRPAFVPSEGYYLVDLDYSQIELRVAAFISGSVPMIEAFQRGDDLHTLLAKEITKKVSVTPEERQAGKSANFGLLYGMGPSGFREYAEDVYDVTVTEERAEQIYQTFFATWVGMREWHEKQKHRAKFSGEVVSPIGRVRRLPDIYSSNNRRRNHAERNAINAPVQGFASDLMQIAAASIQGLIPGHHAIPGVRLVATVHDSIVAEVPQKNWKILVEECQDRMVNGVLPVLSRMGCNLTVPLVADATVGTRWGLGDVNG